MVDQIIQSNALVKEFPIGGISLKRKEIPNKKRILDGITFDLPKGLSLALLGPNGSGKTTLLKTLSTIYSPDGGQASVCGYDLITELAEVRKRISFVTPAMDFQKKLTLKQTLEFFVKVTKGDMALAKDFIEELNGNVVLKPIGLTGGKGVKVAGDHFTDITGAMDYIDQIFKQKIGGAAKVVIEEKAEGEEFTVQAFTDGVTVKAFPAVQDHKRLHPGDKGPNTGGMGSYSDTNWLLPFLTQKDYDDAVHILNEIIAALKQENCPYIGPIYGQFMLTVDGPKVIEINARFGDPEAMNVLPLLETDLLDIGQAMLHKKLDALSLDFSKKATVCKYVVPEGYGRKSLANQTIRLDVDSIIQTGALLFYASVNQEDHDVKTTTSRSLAVVGLSDSIASAEQMCEQALQYVHSDHIYMRHDIGTKDLIQKRIDHMNQLRGVETTV